MSMKVSINTETCGFFAIGLLIHINRTKNKDIYKSAVEYIILYDSNKNNTILKTFFRNFPGSKDLKILSKLYSQR
jgi:hypothetical protein